MAGEEQDDSQERTLEASEEKLRQARAKGDVAQSKEVTTTLLYAGMMLVVLVSGGAVVSGVAQILSNLLRNPDMYADGLLYAPNKQAFQDLLTGLSGVLAPVFLLPAAFVLLSLIAQQAITFAPDKIQPKLSKISLLSNAKQKYGPSGLAEFVKSFVKLMLVGLIAALYLWQKFYELPALSQLPPGILPGQLRQGALGLMLFVVLTSAAIAAIDLPWVRHQYAKKHRMSLQEMKKESKESEGDPQQKSARRRRAEELANNTMLRDVAGADVVIVNPSHYAVALKWDRQRGTVPICVAKGVDALALRIREKAKMSNVPIHADPPCARSMHSIVEVGELIRPEHFAAVAAAIHFSDQARKGFL